MRYAFFCYFFFNDTATTEIYTLSLHDALPISELGATFAPLEELLPQADFVSLHTNLTPETQGLIDAEKLSWMKRSEEHTSELQSRRDLVCRLLLEKKKKNI